MTDSIQAINQMLADCRKQIDSTFLKLTTPIRIVIGNEASDLDSIASSLSYAFFLSKNSQKAEDLVIPIMNIQREELRLKTEADYMLKRVGIETSSLLFLDEVDWPELGRRGLRVTLTDHNQLTESQAHLSERVDEIIDHHKDHEQYPWARKRIVQGLGSATTLVAEIIFTKKPDLVDQGFATLLLGPILLDTANLSPGRTLLLDRAIAARLTKISGESREELFKALQYEKFNTIALDTSDLLRRDHKKWEFGDTTIATSSVPLSVDSWYKQDTEIADGFRAFVSSTNADALITFHYYFDDEGEYLDENFRRELGIFSEHALAKDTIHNILVSEWKGLKTLEWGGQQAGESGQLSFLNDSKRGASRKKVDKLFHEDENEAKLKHVRQQDG